MATNDFMVGADCNYFREMRAAGHRWRVEGQAVEPLHALAEAGVGWARIRVFAREDGINGLAYATATALEAQRCGLRPYLNLFLSDSWATAVKQPAPHSWRDLSVDRRAAAITEYTRRTVSHFKAAGVETDLYQIGNEIEYGICGVYAESRLREDPGWMIRNRIWGDSAELVRAAVAGVREVEPSARFLLHIAHWFNHPFAIAFFRFFAAAGVPIDYVGASYYPTSGIPEHHFGIPNSIEALEEYVDALTAAAGAPLVFAEVGYPTDSWFKGAFQSWTCQVPGYPLNPAGQRGWLEDFLAWCARHPQVAGAFYWSPEYYCHDDWSAFALFDRDGDARPALAAFRIATARGSLASRIRERFGRRDHRAGRAR